VLPRPALFWLLLSSASLAVAQEEFDTVDPLDDDFATGVEVGATIPEFRAVDIDGKTWDFERIRGPKGAVLHFYRSADW
jgi:hypothetical protein